MRIRYITSDSKQPTSILQLQARMVLAFGFLQRIARYIDLIGSEAHIKMLNCSPKP